MSLLFRRTGRYTPGSHESHGTHRWLTACALAALLAYLVPDLASATFGLDGLVYANIAQLLASGEGSFWALPYYELQLAQFTDHPPLGIYLLSTWMILLGQAFWVEKALALVVTLGVCAALVCLFRDTQRFDALRLETPPPAWLLLLALFCMPAATHTLKWGYLEGQLTLVTLLSVWAGLRSIGHRGWAVALGVGSFTAFLIKGPAGLFPLGALPIVLWLAADLGHSVRATSIALATFAACAIAVAALAPDSSIWWRAYLDQQVLASIVGARPAEHGRAYLLVQLAANIGIAAVVVALVTRQVRLHRAAGLWIIIGLCASLPLLLSARQYRHYLLPSLPFFALALTSCIVAPNPGRITRRIAQSALPVLVMSAGIALVLCWAAPGEHATEIRQAAVVAAHLAQTETADSELAAYCPQTDTARLRAYLFRRHRIASVALANHAMAPRSTWVLCAAPPAPGARRVRALSDGLALWQLAQDPDQE